MAEVGPYAASRIAAVAEDVLRTAGVLGTLPTPLDAVRAAAGVRALVPVSELPAGLGSGGRRGEVLGAYWFEERALFLCERQAAPRRRFTEAHELMHALLPWHEAVLREDTERELFPRGAALAESIEAEAGFDADRLDSIEAEANFGAGLLIFQGSEFLRRAGEGPCRLETALALAAEHGASKHATVHHYAQTHRGAVAMLCCGRFPRRDGSLPVFGSVESPAFRRRHGRAASLYPSGLAAGSGLRALAEAARVTSGCAADRVRLGEAPRGRRLLAQAHYNRHAFLVLLGASA